MNKIGKPILDICSNHLWFTFDLFMTSIFMVVSLLMLAKGDGCVVILLIFWSCQL